MTLRDEKAKGEREEVTPLELEKNEDDVGRRKREKETDEETWGHTFGTKGLTFYITKESFFREKIIRIHRTIYFFMWYNIGCKV